jgi:nucleoside-diphosphate-sugar epimerase
VRIVVTGAAGFIGGHVAGELAAAGHEVIPVDRSGPVRVDLAVEPPPGLAGADAVIHLAGRPGVRSSFDDPATWRDNVETTRRLLDACRALPHRPRVVLASSSSVYGSAGRACTEDDEPRPESPYGHAKVAAENLARESGTNVVILRYFSVYGPRQRPDMAFHRFFEAALDGRPLTVFGDGTQSRAFTFVGDVVDATIRAATLALPPGTAINVGHRLTVRVGEAVRRIGALVGGPGSGVTHTAPAPGDVTRTWASTERAGRLLGWTARTGLDEGLTKQLEWHRAQNRRPGGVHLLRPVPVDQGLGRAHPAHGR